MPQTIEIRLFATLRRFLPASPKNYPIEPGMSLSDLIIKLGIPQEEAKLVFVNGKKAGLDVKLKHRDRIGIFPPVGGG
jgi:molybdopterin converting factor small subunit